MGALLWAELAPICFEDIVQVSVPRAAGKVLPLPERGRAVGIVPVGLVRGGELPGN